MGLGSGDAYQTRKEKVQRIHWERKPDRFWKKKGQKVSGLRENAKTGNQEGGPKKKNTNQNVC